MNVTCERCGANFSCQKDAYKGESKCWCDDIKIIKEMASEISNNFCNCLCEKCLKEITQKNPFKRHVA